LRTARGHDPVLLSRNLGAQVLKQGFPVQVAAGGMCNLIRRQGIRLDAANQCRAANARYQQLLPAPIVVKWGTVAATLCGYSLWPNLACSCRFPPPIMGWSMCLEFVPWR
jgi:hypothetical protein